MRRSQEQRSAQPYEVSRDSDPDVNHLHRASPLTVLPTTSSSLSSTQTSSTIITVMLSIRRLEPSSPPSEIDAASELLTSVFADDQLTRIVSSPVPSLHAARTRSTLVTGVLDLAVFTAHESECEKLLGVLILKPPGIVDRHR